MTTTNAAPMGRSERRKAYTYKASLAHTHNVASRRRPGMIAVVRCTRQDCRHEVQS